MVAVDMSTSSDSERAGKPRSLAWDEMSDTTCEDCAAEPCDERQDLGQSPSRQRRRRRGRGKRREINEPPSTPKATSSEPQSVLELFGLTPKASERHNVCSGPSMLIAQGNAVLTPPAACHLRRLQSHDMVCSPSAANESWSNPGECGMWIPAQPVTPAAGAYWSGIPGSQQRMQTAFSTSPFRPEAATTAADASSRCLTETLDSTPWCSSSMSPKEQEALLQNLMPDAYEE